MSKEKLLYEKRALKALSELSSATMSADHICDVFNKILDKAMEIVGVDKASIMHFDPDSRSLKIIAARGVPENVRDKIEVEPGKGISGKVFASGKPLLIEDVKKTSEARRDKKYRSESFISAPVSSFPLKIKGRAIGVFNMTDKKNGKPFTAIDLQLLTTIAGQAAAYVHIYELAEELKESERIAQEIEIAREVQSALLPKSAPDLDGVKAAGSSVMAERLGGDYFDILKRGYASPAFVVADVSGHDIGAALLMTMMRSALHSDSGISVLPPSSVMKKLNRTFYSDLVNAEQFVSMFYGQYIHSTRMFRYSNAGHHPAILCRGGSRRCSQLDAEGTLLGIRRGEFFYEKKVKVEKNDVILMFTDGLIEFKNKKGKRFGISRLKKALKKSVKYSPDRIVKFLIDNAMEFADGEKLDDDITLLVLKFT